MIDLFNEAERPLGGEAFTGPTPGLLPTAGRAIMRGGVRLAEAAALTVAPIFPSEDEATFERKQRQAPEERGYEGLTQEDFYRFVDERLEPAAAFWSPDPATLTTSGKIVSALFELPLQLAAGPAGIVAAPALGTGKELVNQGVDPGTAAGAAALTGATTAAAVALPAAGRTIKETLALVAANPLIGAGQEAITREALQARGYDEQAKMFDPWDPAARSVDLVLGAIFGGLAQYGKFRARAPQEVLDALDTVEAAKQREALNPFGPEGKKAGAAALGKAVQDLAEGRPVDVSEQIRPAAPKAPEPTYTSARFREEVQQVFGLPDEQADAALALVAARAKVAGEELDAWLSKRIAGVEQGAPEAGALFQDRPLVAPFYSKVLAEVEGLQQEKWSGEQLLGKLRKTPGVKEEEIAWTGLEEFLAGKKSITRAEVAAYLQENGVVVREVVKGELSAAESAELETLSRPIFPLSEAEKSRVAELIDKGRNTPKYSGYTLPGGENYRELLMTLPGREYKGGHYDEPNILAHVRFNERTGAGGERILHVEEVQSDWHQQGRDKGYGGQIPDAPFKKTWHELALRRLLRWAAENGFDRLTLTTGEQQAARYDLSKQLDSLSYEHQDGQYRITGQPKGGQAQEFGTFTDAQLPDAIGKEMAEKIRAERSASKDSGTFTGEGLKIGGEGMRGFYDRILPQYLDKFGRKFGARVEQFHIPASKEDAWKVERKPQKIVKGERGFHVQFADGTLSPGWWNSEQDALAAIGINTLPVHSIPITDAMRSALLYEGTPLFQGEKGAVSFLADGRAVIHALEAPDFSTLVHELGHIFRRDLSAGELRELETWLLSKVPGSKWEAADEEKFARAFERYLTEGKAPAPELQGIFDKFKGWLLEIYRRITGTAIDVMLSPKVRAVFDRMLFTAPLKADVPLDVAAGREEVARVRAEMEEEGRELLGIDPDDAPGARLLEEIFAAQNTDALAGFLRSPENVSRALADMLEAEAAALENSTAENLVIDGNRLEAMLSTAANWYLEANRNMRSSGSGMDKTSVVNALRKTARGDFARLTAGQQQMVMGALDAISRQAEGLAREIDAQDLQVGDRYATPDLGQRVVVGERDGRLYLDDGTTLDTAGTVRIVGEIDQGSRPADMPQSAAEFYLKEQGDFEVYAGQDSEGNPIMRSAAEMIHEARAELAKAEAQEHLYKRAAFCLNLG